MRDPESPCGNGPVTARRSPRRTAALLLSLIPLAPTPGCAGKKIVLDLKGAILYEKPKVASVSHTLTDDRLRGGRVTVRVTVVGDAGLDASFDIAPGVVERAPLVETAEGTYVGEYGLPLEVVGGPFSVIGRLHHPRAGESTLRDPRSLTVTLVDRIPPTD